MLPSTLIIVKPHSGPPPPSRLKQDRPDRSSLRDRNANRRASHDKLATPVNQTAGGRQDFKTDSVKASSRTTRSQTGKPGQEMAKVFADVKEAMVKKQKANMKVLGYVKVREREREREREKERKREREREKESERERRQNQK